MSDAAHAAPSLRPRGPRRRLAALGCALLLSGAVYMLAEARAPWDFLLPFRGLKLAALALVGAALATATVLFQTITANRILTPSLLGFETLYILVLTITVHTLGTAGRTALGPIWLYALNLAVMAGLGLLVFTLLMRLARGDMLRLVLTGIVLGLVLRALTGFLQRMIDPAEFQTVQALSFARFTRIEPLPLALSAGAILPAMALAFALRHRLDVLALGPVTATGLGEPPHRLNRLALALISVLVGAATALAGPLAAGGFGPVSFFGLIATALTHLAFPAARHAVLIPAAALIGALILVAGQTLMERVFALATPLTLLIELIGGAVFLTLLLTRNAR